MIDRRFEIVPEFVVQVLDEPPPLRAVFVVQLVVDLALAVLGALEQLRRPQRPARP